jgi:hypothetical protein
MKCTKENILKLLEVKKENMLIKFLSDDKTDDYREGYLDAIKEINFIVSVVWED